jgi:lysozyme family protein
MAVQDYPHPCGDYVLKSEGGYTNNKRDPGGPTNWGITIYDGRMYWKPNATADDMKAMPLSVAQGIYKPKYWDALACDQLPGGLDYTVYDYGVNSGIARSGRILRLELGLPQNDWHVTPDVLAKIATRDPAKLIQAISDERLNFLQHLSTWDEFGKGWGSRVRSVDSISLHMWAAHSNTPPQNLSVVVASPPLAPHVATDEQPMAKGAASPDDLFAHLAADTWNTISNFMTT